MAMAYYFSLNVFSYMDLPWEKLMDKLLLKSSDIQNRHSNYRDACF